MVTGVETNGNITCIGNIKAIPRLNFSGICLADGPTAMNRMDLVSIFPSGLTVAATWDKSLMHQRGAALGQEFRDKGAHIMLGLVFISDCAIESRHSNFNHGLDLSPALSVVTHLEGGTGKDSHQILISQGRL